MNFVGQLNKGETKMLSLIADYFISKDDHFHAIEVYQKMGDYKNLAQVYIRANQWDDVSFEKLICSCYISILIFLNWYTRLLKLQMIIQI